jgi:hypothetical protein
VASLCRKYRKAEAAVESMNSAVEELTHSIGKNSWISEWKRLEEKARKDRGEKLMIYNVSHAPGVFLIPMTILLYHHTIVSSFTSKKTTRPHINKQEEQICSVVIARVKPRS